MLQWRQAQRCAVKPQITCVARMVMQDAAVSRVGVC
jgi:hypothetical protein